MAKTKTAKNTVTAFRNGVKKEFTSEQWNSMKKNKSTYGWKLKSDLPEEVLKKDSIIESSKIEQLTQENEALKEQNSLLEKRIESLVKQNMDLEAKLSNSAPDSSSKDLEPDTKSTAKK